MVLREATCTTSNQPTSLSGGNSFIDCGLEETEADGQNDRQNQGKVS